MSEYKTNFQRKEIKYLLSARQYESLQLFLSKIAEVDEYGKTRINNIYFDTPSFRLIRTSLEKPLYKEKLRLRTYGRTNDDTNAFIEIKKKYKGIVYKRRVNGAYQNAYDYLVKNGLPLDDSQISMEIEEFRKLYQNPVPAMRICYDRVAMAGKEDKDLRITFDSNIIWDEKALDLRAEGKGHQILRKGEVLMELKVLNSIPNDLSENLSELGIFPVSFSKYGRGYQDMMDRNTRELTLRHGIFEFVRKGEMVYA